ncbi:uncharacterized protein DUF2794 [Rhodothalassium salexigens DSM 2132]|uniref:Uncharacterized protein DUF2794 n=1 Tax=Rhodothalassium salexigens DSM 2132 TaxID=1188247 RepID=A0A4R2P8Y9_RHOSA|nr:DUF2794 domain-containing protein [Rhodothalassium salexigens]MBB4212489.1 hypothetical protein [Rhodothalassium salexigens DSM 2132]TCP31469.1 uncharacterized protein DUF2794 [Rhodothalassium salexigens DSM 2132]
MTADRPACALTLAKRPYGRNHRFMDEQSPITPFPKPDKPARRGGQVAFRREELMRLMTVYGRFVSEGLWRDYALHMGAEEAEFAVYRRASEVPVYRIVKCPALARKQGAWRIQGMDGRVLKRGRALEPLLRYFDAKLLKLVED